MSETIERPKDPFTIVSRDEAMSVLREGGVPDSLIASAFGMSRQRVHSRLGPRPSFKRLRAPKVQAKIEDLSEYVKEWRIRNGFSIAQAARLTGTNSTSWWKWEQGMAGCQMPGLLLRYLALLEEKGDIR